MDRTTAERFIKENRPVWFVGTWTSMPVKARIVKICGDSCARVEYICEDGCDACGPRDVPFSDMFESKEDLIAAAYEYMREKTEEIRASVQTKDDCIRYMFMHMVPGGEEIDWTARRAIQKIAAERWGLGLD